MNQFAFSFSFVLALVGNLLLVGTAQAEPTEHFAAVGEPPVCDIDSTGLTHVFFTSSIHPSFKCTHSNATCACTLKHPTHHRGGCMQLESKAAGKLFDVGGDCSNSGKDTAAPTAAPTQAPTVAPTAAPTQAPTPVCTSLAGVNAPSHLSYVCNGNNCGGGRGRYCACSGSVCYPNNAIRNKALAAVSSGVINSGEVGNVCCGGRNPGTYDRAGWCCGWGYPHGRPATDRCQWCPCGKYQPADVGVQRCLNCPAGKYTDTEGAGECKG